MNPLARALAATLIATILAIAATVATAWLLGQSPMFASGLLAIATTVSVVLPTYLYTLSRIFRAVLRVEAPRLLEPAA